MRGAVMHREHILVVPPAARKLQIALFLTAVILVAEVVTGFLANSLALLSDAGHVLMDLFALGLSWVAVRQSARAASGRMTYGYHRMGLLVGAWVPHEERRHSLNVRSAFLHVLGDLLGSLGVLVAAAAIVVAGWVWMDAAVSVLIGGIILVGAVRLLRAAVHIFL